MCYCCCYVAFAADRLEGNPHNWWCSAIAYEGRQERGGWRRDYLATSGPKVFENGRVDQSSSTRKDGSLVVSNKCTHWFFYFRELCLRFPMCFSLRSVYLSHQVVRTQILSDNLVGRSICGGGILSIHFSANNPRFSSKYNRVSSVTVRQI